MAVLFFKQSEDIRIVMGGGLAGVSGRRHSRGLAALVKSGPHTGKDAGPQALIVPPRVMVPRTWLVVTGVRWGSGSLGLITGLWALGLGPGLFSCLRLGHTRLRTGWRPGRLPK